MRCSHRLKRFVHGFLVIDVIDVVWSMLAAIISELRDQNQWFRWDDFSEIKVIM